uniref:Uncharacterized protein n=1 Tax=Globodera rostochiensis TaxID=31243 RepID=A0A914IFE8_GLORO
MRFILSFIIIIEILFADCSARLKCRRNTVGTIKGVDLEPNFSEEECDSTYFWQASNKYCFAAHCFKGNEWLTHYGCTTSAERGTCSDKVGKELKDLFGLVVSCSFCTIGRKNWDMSNNNFPLYNQSVPNQTSNRDFDSTMVPPSTEAASFDVTSGTLMPSGPTTVPSSEAASFDVTSETLMPSGPTTVPSTEAASFDVTSGTLMPSGPTTVPSTEAELFDVTSGTLMPSGPTTVPSTEAELFDVTSETPNATMSMSMPFLETLTKMAAPFAEFGGKSSGTGLNIALPILIVSMTSKIGEIAKDLGSGLQQHPKTIHKYTKMKLFLCVLTILLQHFSTSFGGVTKNTKKEPKKLYQLMCQDLTEAIEYRKTEFWQKLAKIDYTKVHEKVLSRYMEWQIRYASIERLFKYCEYLTKCENNIYAKYYYFRNENKSLKHIALKPTFTSTNDGILPIKEVLAWTHHLGSIQHIEDALNNLRNVKNHLLSEAVNEKVVKLVVDMPPLLIAEHSENPSKNVHKIQNNNGTYTEQNSVDQFLDQLQFQLMMAQLSNTRSTGCTSAAGGSGGGDGFFCCINCSGDCCKGFGECCGECCNGCGACCGAGCKACGFGECCKGFGKCCKGCGEVSVAKVWENVATVAVNVAKIAVSVAKVSVNVAGVAVHVAKIAVSVAKVWANVAKVAVNAAK